MESARIIETPRDAMQGIKHFIPTDKKTAYIQSLLEVGFYAVEVGSFVSPKAVPQMKDTAEVIENLDLSATATKLIAIVGNLRGAEEGCKHEKLSFISYPHSISDHFLMLNLSSSLQKSRNVLADILNTVEKNNQEFLVYISMSFGNPYGDEWSMDILAEEVEYLRDTGVKYIALSDTVGLADPASIAAAFMHMVPQFPGIEFGLHLHTTLEQWYEKIDAAYKHGCKRFDGVINGLGGCPMARHELVGNLQTTRIIEYFEKNNLATGIDKNAFEEAYRLSMTAFTEIHSDNNGIPA